MSDPSNSIVYPKEQWDQHLKEKIRQFEHNCEQLGKRLQAEYQRRFEDKGIFDLEVKISRSLDCDEFDHLTAQDCFMEVYASQLVIEYAGDHQAVVDTTWQRGSKAGYMTHETLEEIEEILIERLEDLLYWIEEKQDI